MKFRDLKDILPDETYINLFVDNMFYAFEPHNSIRFTQFKNADIIRIIPMAPHEVTMEISTLDLEA